MEDQTVYNYQLIIQQSQRIRILIKFVRPFIPQQYIVCLSLVSSVNVCGIIIKTVILTSILNIRCYLETPIIAVEVPTTHNESQVHYRMSNNKNQDPRHFGFLNTVASTLSIFNSCGNLTNIIYSYYYINSKIPSIQNFKFQEEYICGNLHSFR